jgi:prolyl-tRNA synthetase
VSASAEWTFAGEPTAPLEKVYTPGISGVDEVCNHLKVAPRHFLKTFVFQAESPIQIRWLVATLRGDHQLDEQKLSDAARDLGVTRIRPADSPQARQRFAIGFVGPDAGTNTPDAVLIVDPAAAQGGSAWVTGANEVDYHVRNFNWFREAGDKLADPAKVSVADIRIR